MKSSIRTLSIVLFLLISNCAEKPIEPTGDFTVSGIVVNNNGAVDNVEVNIDNAVNWTTKTDENGNFKIEKVSEGNHQLTVIKNDNDNSFIMREEKLVVNSDIELQSLELPKPIHLNEVSNTTATSAELSWNKAEASDFREYKLYRHLSSGLDETTGTLIHVSTEKSDTLFIDENLLPSENYYYRIYVMNDYGKLGGSNIVSFKTEKINLIKNGGFEDGLLQFPQTWDLIWNAYDYTNIKITDSIAFSGKYSLYLNVPAGVTIHETFVAQTLNKSLISYGKKYRISFMAKYDSFIDENTSNGLSLELKWCDGTSYLGYPAIRYLDLPKEGSAN